jgi:hypothetical protein
MALVVCEVVCVVNKIFKKMISLPIGEQMQNVMASLKAWHGLPNMKGTIDGCHFKIVKPTSVFVADYFYHKTRGCSMTTQAVVDNKKQFNIHLVMGMRRSVNDAKVLWKSTLYANA